MKKTILNERAYTSRLLKNYFNLKGVSMNLILSIFFILLLHANAKALVVGPDSKVIKSEQVISLGFQNESGLAKPLETSDSWISSKIETQKINYSYGLGDFEGFGSEHILGFTLSSEKSGAEEKNGIVYDSKNESNLFSIQYSLKPVSETDYSLTVYTSVLLGFSGNKEKFIQSRNDQLQLGLRTSSRIEERGMFDSWLHYGSGFSGKQNSYLATSISLGYRFGQPGKIEPSFRLGPYFEFDLDSRRDTKYENAFGTGHPSEPIRQIKLADAIYLDLAINRKYLLSVVALRKRAGEDLRSTEATSLQFSAKF